MTIRIGRPDPEEADGLAALHIRCWREAYRDFVPAEILDRAGIEKRRAVWRAALGDPQRIVLAAYGGDSPVGFIMAGTPLEQLFDDMDGHVPALYVAASHYRLGLGRRLLGRAAQEWAAAGGRSLALGVLADNLRARDFYEALGGRLVRSGVFDWDGHLMPDAVYVFENLAALAADSHSSK